MQALQDLKATNKTIQGVTGFVQLLNNKALLVWLEFSRRVMPHVEILYKQIQSINTDAYKIKNALEDFHEAKLKIPEKANTISGCKEISEPVCKESKEIFAYTNHLMAAKPILSRKFQKL